MSVWWYNRLATLASCLVINSFIGEHQTIGRRRSHHAPIILCPVRSATPYHAHLWTRSIQYTYAYEFGAYYKSRRSREHLPVLPRSQNSYGYSQTVVRTIRPICSIQLERTRTNSNTVWHAVTDLCVYVIKILRYFPSILFSILIITNYDISNLVGFVNLMVMVIELINVSHVLGCFGHLLVCFFK